MADFWRRGQLQTGLVSLGHKSSFTRTASQQDHCLTHVLQQHAQGALAHLG